MSVNEYVLFVGFNDRKESVGSYLIRFKSQLESKPLFHHIQLQTIHQAKNTSQGSDRYSIYLNTLLENCYFYHFASPPIEEGSAMRMSRIITRRYREGGREGGTGELAKKTLVRRSLFS